MAAAAVSGIGEDMAVEHRLAVGTRVKLRSASHLVDLRSPFGEVVRPDEYEGYYVVRLDCPALYHQADGTTRELPEIVEMADNMVPLAKGKRTGIRLPDGRVIAMPEPSAGGKPRQRRPLRVRLRRVAYRGRPSRD